MSDSVQPHRWKPIRLLHPWDSPGRNTGVGFHFLLQYRFSAIPTKLPAAFFTELEQKLFTIHMETQKTLHSQSSLEIEEWSWRNQLSRLQTILQSYSHQNSMALAQKQKYRPMEQDRKPRNKPVHPWVPYF